MSELLNFGEALAWLDGHINLETGRVHDGTPGPGVEQAVPGRMADPPSLDRMARLVAYLGEPQLDLAVLHITGTNGKGSTARIATALLLANGLSTGTYTSPHLSKPNERIMLGGEPIADDTFAEMVRVLMMAEQASGQRNSWFELVTAGAFRVFSDEAVEAAVVEVGAGGRWDATNVANAATAVITNIDLDHTQWFGPTRRDVAAEKIGIVKPGATALIGETDPDLADFLERRASELGAAAILRSGIDFACDSSRPAFGGRLVTLRTPSARYADLLVPLHGAHQGENAAIALAAVEAFTEETLTDDVVREGFANVANPGRMEIAGRDPLVIVDGAHNPAGARAALTTLHEEFAANPRRILIVGFLAPRDVAEMLEALEASGADLVIAVAPASPRAMDPAEVVRLAAGLGARAVAALSVEAALDRATAEADEETAVLVCGSIYLVAEARRLLGLR